MRYGQGLGVRLRACNHQKTETYAAFTTKQGMVHLVGHTSILPAMGQQQGLHVTNASTCPCQSQYKAQKQTSALTYGIRT